MWHLGKPTIARVQGWAMAGGFGLALACDLVIASERARFGAPELNVGLWPYMVTVPMTRSMPAKKALELMLTSRVVDATEADRIGFVTRVVPHDQLDAAVGELAATLASKPPGAMRLGRESFYAVWDSAASEALPQLHAMLTVTSQTAEASEGIAAFMEKRAPAWQIPSDGDARTDTDTTTT
jgi:enoyl-CoA hydratase/carnithine racemase